MLYIAFNKRSSVTARLLSEFFNSQGLVTRTINRKRFKVKPDVLLRWGNSYLDAPKGCLEINSKESVRLASDKRLMAYTLIKAGVNFPEAFISPMSANEIRKETGEYDESFHVLHDENTELYYRNAQGIVRRRGHYIQGDLYGTTPIDRSREFRVHIFKGKTIGIYEKFPHDEGQPYCKNDNCDFKRLDLSDPLVRSSIKGVRPQAKLAVESLGLDFGGADVIISKDGGVFVNEVNSAPALNEPNLLRYFEEIKLLICDVKE